MAKPRRKPGKRVDATGRSRGDPKHVRLYQWLLDSDAYRALDCTARALLVEFYALCNGRNNGEIFLSVREAARRLGVAPNTAVKAIRELEAKGFIRPKQRGSFNWKGGKATIWILTEYGHAGELPTKDFMRWRPDPENQNAVSVLAPSRINSCDRAAVEPPARVPRRINS